MKRRDYLGYFIGFMGLTTTGNLNVKSEFIESNLNLKDEYHKMTKGGDI